MSLNEAQLYNIPKSSRVFISYSHDSPQHKRCVLKLSNRLRSEGIDCNIDQYETCPSEGWFRWMVNQIEEADFVLIVCTDKYEKRFKGKEEAGKGLGAKWEGAIITQELYHSEANNKCIPIVFSPEDSEYIPSILKSATYYALNIEEINDEIYDELYARLTGQKLVLKPDLGELRHLEPIDFLDLVSEQNYEVEIDRNSQKPVIGDLRKVITGDQSYDIPKTLTSPFTDIEFVLIPAGKFMMGSPSGEQDRYNDEGPVHEVIIKNPFYLGKYPVTQKQWEKVMGSNPSHFKGDNLPVEQVSWDGVQKFIKKLAQMEGTDKYRLPSEAEWEYACRAGATTRYSFGDEESKLEEYAWYSDNSGGKTHSVGQKKPNLWGLYDVYGNVWEWVQDEWWDTYNIAPLDGSAWQSKYSYRLSRIVRGGSWNYAARHCRSASRYRYSPGYRNNVGFRLLREI